MVLNEICMFCQSCPGSNSESPHSSVYLKAPFLILGILQPAVLTISSVFIYLVDSLRERLIVVSEFPAKKSSPCVSTSVFQSMRTKQSIHFYKFLGSIGIQIDNNLIVNRHATSQKDERYFGDGFLRDYYQILIHSLHLDTMRVKQKHETNRTERVE